MTTKYVPQENYIIHYNIDNYQNSLNVVEYYVKGGALMWRNVNDYPILHGISLSIVSSFAIEDLNEQV